VAVQQFHTQGRQPPPESLQTGQSQHIAFTAFGAGQVTAGIASIRHVLLEDFLLKIFPETFFASSLLPN